MRVEAVGPGLVLRWTGCARPGSLVQGKVLQPVQRDLLLPAVCSPHIGSSVFAGGGGFGAAGCR